MTQVQHVLRECERHLRSKYNLPRPLREILQDLGVDLVEMPGSDLRVKFHSLTSQSPTARSMTNSPHLSGFFVSGRHPKIYLEPGLDIIPRVRFTAAHELAHHLVHEITGVVPGGDYWDHEVACNWFASNFLAPTDAVSTLAGPRGREWLNSLPTLAETFKVSMPVIAGALTEISGGEIVFIQLKSGLRQGRQCFVVSDSSTRRLFEKAYGVGAKATLSELGLSELPGTTFVSAVPKVNLGSLKLMDSPALFRRHKAQLWGMVKQRL